MYGATTLFFCQYCCSIGHLSLPLCLVLSYFLPPGLRSQQFLLQQRKPMNFQRKCQGEGPLSWSKVAEIDPSSFQGTLLPSPPLWDEAPQRQHSAPHCTKSFGKQEQAVAGGKATVHPALNTTSAILPRKPQLSGITVHDEASYMVIPQHATADPLHSWGSPGLLWIKCRHIIIFLSN